jgi:hypothetical protein
MNNTASSIVVSTCLCMYLPYQGDGLHCTHARAVSGSDSGCKVWPARRSVTFGVTVVGACNQIVRDSNCYRSALNMHRCPLNSRTLRLPRYVHRCWSILRPVSTPFRPIHCLLLHSRLIHSFLRLGSNRCHLIHRHGLEQSFLETMLG